MRARWFWMLMSLAALGTSTAAQAAALVIPNAQPLPARAEPSAETAWTGRLPIVPPQARPVGDVIAARLGIAGGHAELFRIRVEEAPSDKTVLDGVVDGRGFKLKLTW